MPFSDVLGHDRPKERLRVYLERDQLPGTLLFQGPWGVGKTRLALALGRALNCHRETLDACDECPSCTKALKFAHPDLRFVFPMPRGRNDAEEEKIESAALETYATDPLAVIQFEKNATIWVDKVRALRRASALSVSEGQRKVFVIRDADAMGEHLAGSLLKILEEPPRETHFILTSSRPQALLPTIVSRCQVVQFAALPASTIAEVLADERGVKHTDATLCAALAQGSLARALLLAAEDVRGTRDLALTLLKGAAAGGAAYHQAVDALAALRDRNKVRRVAHTLALWHRDLLAVRYGLNTDGLANADQLNELKRQAKTLEAAEIGRRVALFEGLRLAMDRNVGYAVAAHGLMAALADPEAGRAALWPEPPALAY